MCGRESLLAREQHYIDNGCEYNLAPTAGSPLGVKWCESARRRASERRRGVKKSEAHCLAMADRMKSAWRDDEFREKMSDAIAKSYSDDLRALRGEQSHERWSDDEYREAMRAKLRESYTPELRKLRGDQSRQRWSDPSYRARMKAQKNLAGLTEEQVREIRALRASGIAGREVAARFGIKEGAVCEIHKRRSYKWVSEV